MIRRLGRIGLEYGDAGRRLTVVRHDVCTAGERDPKGGEEHEVFHDATIARNRWNEKIGAMREVGSLGADGTRIAPGVVGR